jgi:hypothetical protein
MPQPLSSKESSLFRTVVRNYEDKQYKKGGYSQATPACVSGTLTDCTRTQGGGTDSQEESEAWRYNGNEGFDFELNWEI